MSSSKKVVTLRSSDGEMFEVDESVAIQSQTIKHMIEDGCANRVIPLLNVSGEVLSKVIVYLKKHVESTASAATDDDSDKSGEESLKAWDAEFVGVEQSTIFNLILAANYLNVKGLLDLTCQTVADMIKGKTTEEIREAFNIENDFNPEEEEEIRRKNMWLFR